MNVQIRLIHPILETGKSPKEEIEFDFKHVDVMSDAEYVTVRSLPNYQLLFKCSINNISGFRKYEDDSL